MNKVNVVWFIVRVLQQSDVVIGREAFDRHQEKEKS